MYAKTDWYRVLTASVMAALAVPVCEDGMLQTTVLGASDYQVQQQAPTRGWPKCTRAHSILVYQNAMLPVCLENHAFVPACLRTGGHIRRQTACRHKTKWAVPGYPVRRDRRYDRQYGRVRPVRAATIPRRAA